jgi:uncharacterized protein involved in exopolysaccharide biosynthesis
MDRRGRKGMSHDLHYFLGVLRKRRWMVLGSVMLALGGSVLVDSMTPPRYAAT